MRGCRILWITFFVTCQANRYYDDYHYRNLLDRWNPHSWCDHCVDQEMATEVPLVDRRGYTRPMLHICDTSLHPDEIYATVVGILGALEDTLRGSNCEWYTGGRVRVHRVQPREVRLAYTRISRLPLFRHVMADAEDDSISEDDFEYHRNRRWWHSSSSHTRPVIRTFYQKSQEMIQDALHSCTVDYRKVQKVVRLGLKLLINRIECDRIRLDVTSEGQGGPNITGSYPDYYRGWPPSSNIHPWGRPWDGKSDNVIHPWNRNPDNAIHPWNRNPENAIHPWGKSSLSPSPDNAIHPWNPDNAIHPWNRDPDNAIHPWTRNPDNAIYPWGKSNSLSSSPDNAIHPWTKNPDNAIWNRDPWDTRNPANAIHPWVKSKSTDESCTDCRANQNVI